MSERQTDESSHQMGTTMKRRGILAAAGAVVAGIVAKRASGTVGAAQVPVIMENSASGAPLNGPGATVLFIARSDFNISAGAAVIEANTSKPGMRGIDGNDSFTGIGVRGRSSAGVGVQGLVPSTSGAGNTIAVQGINQATGTGGIGVLGQSDTATGIGVQGQSASGVGVFGVSNGNAGVLGITTAPGNAGLGGIANVSGTAAFAGTSTNPNAFAGFFTGDVFVNGNFTVLDPTKKHGAIAHPDGTHRILYSMESPESWVEDFGKGELVDGRATVTLDPDYVAIIVTDDYHVFPVPDGDCNGLYIADRTVTGFEVRELGGGTSDVPFRYRVVARPRTDNPAARLEPFRVPDVGRSRS